MWDVETGEQKQRQEFKGHGEGLCLVVLSSDGKLLASESSGMVQVWDAVTGERKYKLGDCHHSTTFSPDGKLLASMSMVDDKVQVRDAVTGEQKYELGWGLFSIKFSPNSELLAGGLPDMVRVWDVVTGEERQNHQTTHVVRQLEFSADGSSILTDNGNFDLGLSNAVSQDLTPSPPASLELHKEWLRYHGQDVLWLPHEYRGSISVAYGDTLVIGQTSDPGAVSFFRIGKHDSSTAG